MPQRRKPYNPAKDKAPPLSNGQLGIANPYRQQHSKEGYEVEQLAVGHREGGVIRSRERALLTHPNLITELYNLQLKAVIEKNGKVPERIKPKLTPSDNVSADHRFILWAWLQTEMEVLGNKIDISNYEQNVRGTDSNRLPMTQNQFDRRRFYAWFRMQPGMVVLRELFLKYILHDQPGLAVSAATGEIDAGEVLRKAEIGMWVTGLSDANERDSKAHADGALAIGCKMLSEAARDFQVIEARRIRQIQSYKQNRLI